MKLLRADSWKGNRYDTYLRISWAELFENLWKEVAIADNGRSQSMDGPGAEGARYKKNGELRQPRTQEEKVIPSLNREF